MRFAAVEVFGARFQMFMQVFLRGVVGFWRTFGVFYMRLLRFAVKTNFSAKHIFNKEYFLQRIFAAKTNFPINTNFPIKPVFNKKHSLKEYFELFPKYTPALRLEGRDPNRLAAKSP